MVASINSPPEKVFSLELFLKTVSLTDFTFWCNDRTSGVFRSSISVYHRTNTVSFITGWKRLGWADFYCSACRNFCRNILKCTGYCYGRKFTLLTVEKSESLVSCVVDNGEHVHNELVVSVRDSMEVLQPEEPIFPWSLGFPQRGLTS